MGHILFQTFKIVLSTLLKKHETKANQPPVHIYVNKIKNRIVFTIKTDYKVELLSPEKIKLLVSAKKDVNQDKNGENVPKWESIEVVLVHCNLFNNSYKQTSKILFTFVLDK